MKTLYNISIHFYVIGIYIYSFFNLKAKQWLKGRKNIFSSLEKVINNHKNIVWFHCASLGEFEQGKSIIEMYKKKYSKHKILLTFFSPSGFEIRKATPLADFVFYLPSDTKANASKFISIVKPIKVVFVKYEFWFHYMAELKNQNIPFYSVSSIFRKNQIFFKCKWAAKQLKNVSHFFVQDNTSADLLKSIGFTNITISGDSRFDSVNDKTNSRKNLPLIREFAKSKPTIICGSTWPKDEILLTQYIKDYPEKNYIIAPHELQYISALQKQTNGLLYSEANKKNIYTSNVLIIDSIGILANIYQYGKLAYIGGGFGNGIHNILEAVTFGLPVIFGTRYNKVREAKELIRKQGAISISNYKELDSAIKFFNQFDNNIATSYIKDNIGATNMIINHILADIK